MKIKNFRGIYGFSYIEVLTAIVMLAVVIVPITRLILFSSFGTREANEYVIAYNLAADKIENMKMLPFDKIENEENDIFTKQEAEKVPDFHKFMQLYKNRYRLDYKYFEPTQGIFGRTVTIDDKVDPVNTPPKLKKITVNVYMKADKKQFATINTLMGE